jgi:PAS domain S-box-containing protein
MRQFLVRALQKLDKLTPEQSRHLFFSLSVEIERLEAVLDSLSEGIMVLDKDHCLILANKFARRYLPPDIIKMRNAPFWEGLMDKKVAAYLENVLAARDKAEGWEFDGEFHGSMKRVSLSVWPLVSEGQISGSLIHAEDVTEKRSKEARLHRMESLASLTTMAAGVAHEIKNPLGSLSIHIQLIQKTMRANRIIYETAHPQGPPPGEEDAGGLLDTIDRHLEVVNEEIARLNQIVVDFLFAVRPMNVDLKYADINILAKELMDFVFLELKQAGIASCLDLDEKIPALYFDERYMKQALLNLINNAMAAMSGGGTLKIITKLSDHEALITVSDTGIGIPDENMEKIFEPYFTTKSMGSGLGLTLVFKIVREHFGEISVKSFPGKGSAFTISLPLPQIDHRLIGGPG